MSENRKLTKAEKKMAQAQLALAQLTMAPALAPQDKPQAAPEAPKAPRLGVQPPRESKYTFTPGEQVCLVNLEHSSLRQFRSHYEYVKREGVYDHVKRTTDGEIVRVWLNKLMPMREALQLKKQVEASAVKTA